MVEDIGMILFIFTLGYYWGETLLSDGQVSCDDASHWPRQCKMLLAPIVAWNYQNVRILKGSAML